MILNATNGKKKPVFLFCPFFLADFSAIGKKKTMCENIYDVFFRLDLSKIL